MGVAACGFCVVLVVCRLLATAADVALFFSLQVCKPSLYLSESFADCGVLRAYDTRGMRLNRWHCTLPQGVQPAPRACAGSNCDQVFSEQGLWEALSFGTTHSGYVAVLR